MKVDREEKENYSSKQERYQHKINEFLKFFAKQNNFHWNLGINSRLNKTRKESLCHMVSVSIFLCTMVFYLLCLSTYHSWFHFLDSSFLSISLPFNSGISFDRIFVQRKSWKQWFIQRRAVTYGTRIIPSRKGLYSQKKEISYTNYKRIRFHFHSAFLCL